MNKTKTINLRALLPLLGLVVVFVAFAVLTGGRSLKQSNLETIFNQAFFIMLAGIGATFVYAHGGIDLSIGALQGICILVTVVMMRSVGVVPALLVSIVIGIVSGVLLGGVSVYLKIPVFIAGLGIQYIYRGIVRVCTSTSLITIPSGYTWLNNLAIKLVILVLVAIVIYYMFNHTRVGRYVKAIGGNTVVADLSGVNVKKYMILSYAILGACVGLGALLAGIRAGGVNPNSGSSYEMDVLIAVVLGGMPLTGGAAARVSCGAIGALLIVVIENGFILMGADPNLVGGIKGIIFIITVFVTLSHKKGQVVN